MAVIDLFPGILLKINPRSLVNYRWILSFIVIFCVIIIAPYVGVVTIFIFFIVRYLQKEDIVKLLRQGLKMKGSLFMKVICMYMTNLTNGSEISMANSCMTLTCRFFRFFVWKMSAIGTLEQTMMLRLVMTLISYTLNTYLAQMSLNDFPFELIAWIFLWRSNI